MKQWWNKSLNRFLSAFVVLLILLLSLGIKPTLINTFGQEIRVEATGWMSHDTFRGDYIQLNYAMERVTFDQMSLELRTKMESVQTDEELWSFLNDQKFYVTFKPNGSLYTIDQVSISKPDTKFYLIADNGWAYYDWQVDETLYPETVKEETSERYMLEHVIGLELYYSLARDYVFEQESDALRYSKLYNDPVVVTIHIYKGEAVLVALDA